MMELQRPVQNMCLQRLEIFGFSTENKEDAAATGNADDSAWEAEILALDEDFGHGIWAAAS